MGDARATRRRYNARTMEPNPAPLAANAATHRQPLPSVGSFLRDAFSLGFRSLVPALPAITLLCFYRFGMGLYLEFVANQTSPLGFPDKRAQAGHLILIAAAYLPLMVLVYTPFLPLQDAIRRGEKKSFLDSIRHVLERMVPFGLSCFAQLAILMTPVFALFFLAAAALSTMPEAPEEVIAGTVFLALIPAVVWVVLAGLFMLFATPALILDGLGPLRSLAFSVREVGRRFWSVIGRLIVGFGLIIVAAMLASVPVLVLAIIAAVAAGTHSPLVTLVKVLWTSVVTALAFPFSVAVLTTLYRAVAPAVGRPVADATTPEAPPSVDEPRQAETPFVFE